MKKTDKRSSNRPRVLYTSEQLLKGFDSKGPMSYLKHLGFQDVHAVCD